MEGGYKILLDKVQSDERDANHDELPFQWPFPNDLWEKGARRFIDGNLASQLSPDVIATTPDLLAFFKRSDTSGVVFRATKYRWRYFMESAYTEYEEWRLSMPVHKDKYITPDTSKFTVYLNIPPSKTKSFDVSLRNSFTIDELYEDIAEAATTFREELTDKDREVFSSFSIQKNTTTGVTTTLSLKTTTDQVRLRVTAVKALGIFDSNPQKPEVSTWYPPDKTLIINPQTADDYEYIGSIRFKTFNDTTNMPNLSGLSSVEPVSRPTDSLCFINYFQLTSLFERENYTSSKEVKNLEYNALFRDRGDILRGVVEFCRSMTTGDLTIALQDAALVKTRLYNNANFNQLVYLSLLRLLCGGDMYYVRAGLDRVAHGSRDVTDAIDAIKQSFPTTPKMAFTMKHWNILNNFFKKHGMNEETTASMTLYDAVIALYALLFQNFKVLPSYESVRDRLQRMGLETVSNAVFYGEFEEDASTKNVEFITESKRFTQQFKRSEATSVESMTFNYWMHVILQAWSDPTVYKDVYRHLIPFTDDPLYVFTKDYQSWFKDQTYIRLPSSGLKNVSTGTLGSVLRTMMESQTNEARVDDMEGQDDIEEQPFADDGIEAFDSVNDLAEAIRDDVNVEEKAVDSKLIWTWLRLDPTVDTTTPPVDTRTILNFF